MPGPDDVQVKVLRHKRVKTSKLKENDKWTSEFKRYQEVGDLNEFHKSKILSILPA